MKILHLTLKKQWFDMIASGEKREEYREKKPYWAARLAEAYISGAFFRPRQYDVVRFRHGYAPDAPTMDVEFLGCALKNGRPEWGAEPYNVYFTIRLGKVLCKQNF